MILAKINVVYSSIGDILVLRFGTPPSYSYDIYGIILELFIPNPTDCLLAIP